MAKTGICSICSRPDASVIDSALAVSGASWRDVARRYGLGRSAVNRHGHRHMGARLRRAAEDRAAGSDPGLLAQIQEFNRQVRIVLAQAANSGNFSAAVSAIAEGRKQLELQGKLLGVLRSSDGPSLTVNFNAADPEATLRMVVAELTRRGYRILPPGAPAVRTTLAGPGEPVGLPAAEVETLEEP